MERLTSSDAITRQYLDSLLVEVRHLDAVKADTGMELYGKKFSTPVMTAALSHLNKFCGIESGENGMVRMARGAFLMNAVCFTGMGSTDELAAMIDTGASVVKIIKTYRDREKITSRIRHAEEHGALAVGLDIDHAFNRQTGYDVVEGEEMRPMTTAELEELCRSTKLPLVVKGVLSVQDAVKCVQAGAGGIVVSHHNGRIDCAMPPLAMLPEILKAVDGAFPVFVDCSLQSGLDVFRCLALGAKACCVGRPIMKPLKEQGAEGVRDVLSGITEDLRYTMGMTCCRDLKHIDGSVLHRL
ncbi:MAG: alpha-hydroxy-acid oxidizing protein [Clostridia bacterium]|nr:alpha-hydroxy-acid oxidizing protein [Clostridia bacterium]